MPLPKEALVITDMRSQMDYSSQYVTVEVRLECSIPIMNRVRDGDPDILGHLHELAAAGRPVMIDFAEQIPKHSPLKVSCKQHHEKVVDLSQVKCDECGETIVAFESPP